jgi:hypothetical protein
MSILTGLKRNSAVLSMVLGLGSFASLDAATIPSAVLPTSNLICNTTTATFGAQPCSTFGITPSDAALTATSDGVTGLKFWLPSVSGFVDNENSGAETTILSLSSTGTVTGTGEPSGIFIPYSDDFSLATSVNGTLGSYSLVFDIKQGSTSIFSGAPTFTGTLTGKTATITGGSQFATINPITSGQTYTVSAVLTVNWNTNSGASGLTITVPQNSFDTNSTTFVATTPEPASFGLLAIGFVAFNVLRRRRRS